MSQAPVAPAATFVIFGAMGDLTRRLLVPALVNLTRSGLLPEDATILGVSYHDSSDDELRQNLAEFVEADDAWQKLSSRIAYLKGDFTERSTFEALHEKLNGNAVFYLATAPSFFGPLVDSLADAGLLDEKDGFRRVVIEKPFGTDLASAQALNRQILARASEAQIYRIDHFLGKETVQNILVSRFGNPNSEAVFNNRYVDHIEITAAETVDVGTRGKFYDATGAMRDMVPNHLFQLLALIGMEPPNSFDADAVRTERAKVIAAIRPIDPAQAVRGQYGGGRIGDRDVTAFRDSADVAADSTTETYVAMKVEVDTWRWSGVPFYLRTGKALKARDTQIVIEYRPVPIKLFRSEGVEDLPPTRLILQLQPDEGMKFEMVAKKPGPVIEPTQVDMTFRYADCFPVGHQTGYETLLYDVLIGDQTLFQRADQIEAGWRAVDPLLKAWEAGGEPDAYAPGSDGPDAAAELLARDGRQWYPIG